MELQARRMEIVDFIGARSRGEARSDGSEHIVIPAKDVSGSIHGTLVYLQQLGFSRDRIHVIVNGCTDNTEAVVRKAGLATVHLQRDIWRTYATQIGEVCRRTGVAEARLRGKGAAMFAGTLVLQNLSLAPDTPVVFLDADIRDIHRPDPVACLLAGWREWRPDVKMVKLASQGRNNDGIFSFLCTTQRLQGVGAFEWPLCGQVLLPWEALREMRLTTGYAVEVAMIADLCLRQQRVDHFGEVAIPAPLVDDQNSDTQHVRMYASIMDFLRIVDGYDSLRNIPFEAFHVPPGYMFVPSDTGGPPKRERVCRDLFLPSIAELF